MINKNSKIFVAGHTGLVGYSVLKLLKKKGETAMNCPSTIYSITRDIRMGVLEWI